ncbi:MAG: DUF2065 domain-containing protein [Pseudomonadota bacterium]
MGDFVTALGIMLVFEGIVYGAFPHFARQIGHFLLNAPDDVLRIGGLASAALGVGLVWFVRGW